MTLSPQRRGRRRLVIPRGSLPDGEAPYSAVLALDRGGHLPRHLLAAGCALFAHSLLALAVAIQHVSVANPPVPPPHREFQVEREVPAPAPPPPPSPPPREEARKAPEVADRISRRALRASPPAPAQAGQVLTQAPETTGPADLTAFDLVVGQGTAYAGGYSAATGTSSDAVEDAVPKIGGVPDAPPAVLPDLSRPALPMERDWACAWPDEAQDTELRDARVTIRVSVDDTGSPTHVDVIGGPSGGFVEAARRCAERERYRVALDTSGKPAAGTTGLFNVHFVR